MWISKTVYQHLLNAAENAARVARDQMADMEKDLLAVDARLQRLLVDNVGLRERLITAEGAMKAAQAMNDLLTIEINVAKQERAQFLQKLFDPTSPIVIQAPKISKDPVLMPPGVDFEDMGDHNASVAGYADQIPLDRLDEPTPLGDELTGLSGQVYDPASELGVSQPRLGDDSQIAPER